MKRRRCVPGEKDLVNENGCMIVLTDGEKDFGHCQTSQMINGFTSTWSCPLFGKALLGVSARQCFWHGLEEHRANMSDFLLGEEIKTAKEIILPTFRVSIIS